jgi:serine kinase of HPr protein (carbohydrate metabolism regulator)
VLIGERAILLRGPAGAGKSSLALRLIAAGEASSLPFVRLVGDDRVHLEAANGRILVRPAESLAGLLEVRGLGIRRLPFEPLAVVGLVVDLDAPDATRLPEGEALVALLEGVPLPRLAVARGVDPLPLVVAQVGTAPTPKAEACALAAPTAQV